MKLVAWEVRFLVLLQLVWFVLHWANWEAGLIYYFATGCFQQPVCCTCPSFLSACFSFDAFQPLGAGSSTMWHCDLSVRAMCLHEGKIQTWHMWEGVFCQGWDK